MESLRGFNETYEKLRAKQLRRTTAHSLIVELAQAGAFAAPGCRVNCAEIALSNETVFFLKSYLPS